jgi:hypothetical protein
MRAPTRLLTASLLICCLTAAAQQEAGVWRAASSNARSITGDIILSNEKLTINFLGFTMVRIRGLEKTEPAAAFDTESNPGGSGALYRLDIAGTRKFLHKNTLCGSEDTQWMATYASPHSLQVAFFSGQKPPTFTPEAIANSTDLCGTYSYVR